VESNGVEIHEQEMLRSFNEFGQEVVGVQTDRGEHAADVVVIATGAWTPLLHRILGVKVPIQPGKGYSITMARPPMCPTLPMIFEEHRTAITPFADRFRIGSTMEFAGYDDSLNRRRLQMLKDNAAIYMKTPTAEPVLEEWWGWRPMVFDGRPIIGFTPKHSNVVIAAGHGMLGLSMATGTGKLVTELVTGAKPHVDASAYRVERF
jgi:D-amino-acid dehydrogenase